MTYYPKSEHKRHQIYIGAFSTSQSTTEYMAYITQFIFDPEISPMNDDDFELFLDLIFESRFGKLHILYYDEQLLQLRRGRGKYRKRPKVIRRLARYSEFLARHSTRFVEDMFFNIFRSCPDIAGELLNNLPSISKMPFIKVASMFPRIVAEVPRIKLYMTFS